MLSNTFRDAIWETASAIDASWKSVLKIIKKTFCTQKDKIKTNRGKKTKLDDFDISAIRNKIHQFFK